MIRFLTKKKNRFGCNMKECKSLQQRRRRIGCIFDWLVSLSFFGTANYEIHPEYSFEISYVVNLRDC